MWDALEAKWLNAYDELIKYKQKFKNVTPPKSYECDSPDVKNLNEWVQRQRRFKKNLSRKKVKLLNDIGFVWDPEKSDFANKIEIFKRFIDREKHCNVPNKHVEEGFHLYAWIRRVVTGKNKLTTRQKHQLLNLGLKFT